MRQLAILLIPLVVATTAAAEQSYPHWDGKESIEAYAKRVHLPPTKTIDLGNGVMLEMVLVPAGSFRMGRSAPERVDTDSLALQVTLGQCGLALSACALLVLLSFVVARAIREKRRPQVSLARLVVLAFIAGLGLLSGLHWSYSEKALVSAEMENKAAQARYMESSEDGQPAHNVLFQRPFYMGKYEVTQEQYDQIMGGVPGAAATANLPVVTPMWCDAGTFCKKVEDVSGEALRLPSESEWEYACRAGTRTAYHSGDDETALGRAAWYRKNSSIGRRVGPHAVGQKEANAWGLYDMHGNVEEWCEDDWHGDYNGAPTDGSAWVDPDRATFAEVMLRSEGTITGEGMKGVTRVLRGGSCQSFASLCRSASRVGGFFLLHPSGFRVAADISSKADMLHGGR